MTGNISGSVGNLSEWEAFKNVRFERTKARTRVGTVGVLYISKRNKDRHAMVAHLSAISFRAARDEEHEEEAMVRCS